MSADGGSSTTACQRERRQPADGYGSTVGVMPAHIRARACRVVLASCVVVLAASGAFALTRNRATTAVVPVTDVTIATDQRTVSATVYTNTCGEPLQLIVSESADTVRVTALVRQRVADCDDIGIPHRLTGRLSRELGGRALESG
jgi:hypothetical protein